MRFLRSRRSFVGAGALAALVAVTLFVVLPALASNAGDYVNPPSADGVLPLDVPVGGTGDCANLFPNLGGGVSEYDNVNPKTKANLASGHNDNVTFGLTMHTTNNQAQMLDLISSGAEILGIGIKGGTQSTAYNYVTGPYVTGTNNGYVTADSGLHAPLQSFTLSGNTETGSQFYSISQLTVCYRPLGSVSGRVYDDLNQSGAYSAGDSGLGGWTVNLYQGAATTPAATATSAADGTYHMNVVFDGTSDYRLCESHGGTWAQTEPTGSTASCESGDLAKGWALPTPSSTQSISKNFGNVAAITCTGPGFGPATYEIGTCKPTQTYVFNSGILNGKPFVSYWVGDTSLGAVPTVEKVTLPDPIQTNGQPQYRNLFYQDGAGFPVDASHLQQMLYCTRDPRSSEFGLTPPYDAVGATGSDVVLPSGQTSCVISLRIYVDAAGNGWLEVYDYSLTDSIRTSG
jgi:hypothetical protein